MRKDNPPFVRDFGRHPDGSLHDWITYKIKHDLDLGTHKRFDECARCGRRRMIIEECECRLYPGGPESSDQGDTKNLTDNF
jgi:hypothetical protein